MVVAGILFAVLQTSSLYIEWQNEPVITILDTIGLPIKDIEFPAVTICPQGSLNEALDAVLFKQMKEYIYNKTIHRHEMKKRSMSEDELSQSEENLKDVNTITYKQMMEEAEKFLLNVYPGAKKKPTHLITMMASEDPMAVLEKQAVLLPTDDEKCDETDKSYQ